MPREFLSDPWFAIGIASFGTAKCAAGVPGGYTKVTNYLPWIESKLKKWFKQLLHFQQYGISGYGNLRGGTQN